METKTKTKTQPRIQGSSNEDKTQNQKLHVCFLSCTDQSQAAWGIPQITLVYK